MVHFTRRVLRPILGEPGIRKKLEALEIESRGPHAFRRMSAQGTGQNEWFTPQFAPISPLHHSRLLAGGLTAAGVESRCRRVVNQHVFHSYTVDRGPI
jgi:hypothetical protein